MLKTDLRWPLTSLTSDSSLDVWFQLLDLRGAISFQFTRIKLDCNHWYYYMLRESILWFSSNCSPGLHLCKLWLHVNNFCFRHCLLSVNEWQTQTDLVIRYVVTQIFMEWTVSVFFYQTRMLVSHGGLFHRILPLLSRPSWTGRVTSASGFHTSLPLLSSCTGRVTFANRFHTSLPLLSSCTGRVTFASRFHTGLPAWKLLLQFLKVLFLREKGKKINKQNTDWNFHLSIVNASTLNLSSCVWNLTTKRNN